MIRIGLKMLVGDRAKYLAMVVGVIFASMLMTQMEATFCGIMARTISAISDLGLPDIWVMNEKVQFVDDIKPLQDTDLYRVSGVSGVEWAVPLYKGILKARLDDGTFQACNVLGIDDATLIGGPPVMIEGQIADLRRSDSIIVDEVGARGKLARPGPDGQLVPLKIGDTLELNDHRAIVVGICRVTRTFQSQPVIYTTYSRATAFAPRERKLLSFVLVKARDGVDRVELCNRITQNTGLAAYQRDEFKWKTVMYFLKNTGIPINIGIGVVMSFIVGLAIVGQTFYSFTLDNLKYLATLKAMGMSNLRLLRMIVLQALLVACLGFGVGIGMSAAIGRIFRNTEMAYFLPWQALAATACSVGLIITISSAISIRKVVKLEPGIVFK